MENRKDTVETKYFYKFYVKKSLNTHNPTCHALYWLKFQTEAAACFWLWQTSLSQTNCPAEKGEDSRETHTHTHTTPPPPTAVWMQHKATKVARPEEAKIPKEETNWGELNCTSSPFQAFANHQVAQGAELKTGEHAETLNLNHCKVICPILIACQQQN